MPVNALPLDPLSGAAICQLAPFHVSASVLREAVHVDVRADRHAQLGDAQSTSDRTLPIFPRSGCP
jgi:hypothetical protein